MGRDEHRAKRELTGSEASGNIEFIPMRLLCDCSTIKTGRRSLEDS